ncbi:glycoside hydrolase family 127 protein [Leifsonia sp. A12D58]|uniref:glycoside hydrolase family 127 protein n=1 Tax=Leifsonia sp. A12D58 TaxID=3397674 RepID=UPI0039E13801
MKTTNHRHAAVDTAAGRVRPLASSSATLTSGVLSDWQERNRVRTIPHSIAELRAAGNLDNLRSVAEGSDGTDAETAYRGRYPFLDTDIFKTLEGLAYELARPGVADGTRAFFEESVALIEAAQAPDGYLNSFFQHPSTPKQPWEDLSWGHELYNLGHLIQAGVAASRQLGDDRLLAVSRAFADLAVQKFGPTGDAQVCGHPEIEMALVELYRATGDDNYLTLATLFIDRRGHGTVDLSVFPAEYFQDNVPLRQLPSATGHAVRMVYLAAGATDVALETGDDELLTEMIRLWDDMVATKLYVTGGLGSRHSDEAIGDRYELPSERSYSETCAAIGTMQWAWRLFIATADAHYLDVFETVLYNGYAAGLSADGCGFFYDNPLQRREDHEQRSGAEADGPLLRRAWFGCPCCPPNIIRWNAELHDYLAAVDESTLYIGQYSNATLREGGLDLEMRTDYPWDGTVTLEVNAADDAASTLALRVPGWCHAASITLNGVIQAATSEDGWLRLDAPLAAGDIVELGLDMPVRAHGSHPYVDATRGSLSVARGPIVYCAEQQDNEVNLDDLIVSAADVHAATTSRVQLTTDTPADSVLVTIPALNVPPTSPGETAPLYPELGTPSRTVAPQGTAATVNLVPYYLWGNRDARAMRVWLRQQ